MDVETANSVKAMSTIIKDIWGDAADIKLELRELNSKFDTLIKLLEKIANREN